MGTNYYARTAPTNVCPTCGRHDEIEQLHIGKSSAGWVFALHIIPEKGLNTLDDWKRFLSAPGIDIWDEYERALTLKELLRIITEREWNKPSSAQGYASMADFHRQNHSQDGPKGLLRHQLDPRYCAGHGEGTWDYMLGEFS